VGAAEIVAFRPDGQRWSFGLQGGVWKAAYPLAGSLAPSGGGWQLRTAEQIIEVYDAGGRLLSLTSSAGRSVTLQYAAPPAAQIVQASDAYGRSLGFQYHASPPVGMSALQSVTLPDGSRIQYTADPVFREIEAVIHADGSTRRYGYLFPADFRRRLQTITDENAALLTTFTHDGPNGTATSTEQPGGAQKYSLSDNRTIAGVGTVRLTSPLGAQTVYTFSNIGGLARLTGQSQPGGAGCGPASSALSYDAAGNIASRSDFNGNKSCHANDPVRHLETVRLEGLPAATACPPDLAAYAIPAGTAQRKISTVWHPGWRLEARRAEPTRLTTWVYNGQPDPTNGNAPAACAPADALLPDGQPIVVLCKKIEQATTDASGGQGFAATLSGDPRVRRYTYNRYGQILSEDGPRTDVADITTSDYYPADAICAGADLGAGRDKGCRGQLSQISNPLGQVTRFTRYNAHGQVEELVDPNGLVTTLAYDARQRLVSRRVGEQLSLYQYDAAGQLIRLTPPDGAAISYTYDAAHRLSAITDALGNRIAYTLDAAGNRTKEDIFDPQNTLVKTLGRAYDALGRLQTLTGVE